MPHDTFNNGNSTGNPMLEFLRAQIESRQPRTLEEARAITAEVMAGYNNAPQADMGGLSPQQVHALTRPDWVDSAVALNADLTLEELSKARMFQNARRLLLALQELGPVKATTTGAFSRKIATRMAEEFEMDDDDRRWITGHKKVINQSDVPRLELLRHLLPQAGLVLFRKGEFRLTKRAPALLNAQAAGALYQIVFKTFYSRINFDALDGMWSALVYPCFCKFGLASL